MSKAESVTGELVFWRKDDVSFGQWLLNPPLQSTISQREDIKMPNMNPKTLDLQACYH
jgi:hypothetical protein